MVVKFAKAEQITFLITKNIYLKGGVFYTEDNTPLVGIWEIEYIKAGNLSLFRRKKCKYWGDKPHDCII